MDEARVEAGPDADILRQARNLIRILQHLPDNSLETETAPTDPFDLLIFDILAYRSVKSNARIAFNQLRFRYPNWRDLCQANLADVAEAIQITGLTNRRAALIQGLAARVVGDFSDTTLASLRDWDDAAILEYLGALPGVGETTAMHLLLYAFDRPVLPYSWPLKRLFYRLGVIDSSTPTNLVLDQAALLVPRGSHRAVHERLHDLARRVCIARAPRCVRCGLANQCLYYRRLRAAFVLSPSGPQRQLRSKL